LQNEKVYKKFAVNCVPRAILTHSVLCELVKVLPQVDILEKQPDIP
jgi:hypothetical protein